MEDQAFSRPDHAGLFHLAAGQHGYFTTAQARDYGVGFDLLSYHVRTGRFIRVRRGLYRLRDYPSHPHEEVMAAWLAAGPEQSVVSHESALDLLELSDLIPDAVHLTVPRSRRHPPRLPGVRFHTSRRPPKPEEVVSRAGILITDATRSILDVAESGAAPEQIEAAVVDAIRRGMTSAERLRSGAESRGQRVERLIAAGLASVG